MDLHIDSPSALLGYALGTLVGTITGYTIAHYYREQDHKKFAGELKDDIQVIVKEQVKASVREVKKPAKQSNPLGRSEESPSEETSLNEPFNPPRVTKRERRDK